MIGRVQRLDLDQRLSARTDTDHPVDGIDLEVHRTVDVRNDVMFRVVRVQVDPVERAREEVDDGRAVEAELRMVQCVLEVRCTAIDEQQQFELVAGRPGQRRVESADREEQQPLGKGKVLLQQPVPLETAGRERQQRLVVPEADLAHRPRGQSDRRHAFRSHHHADAVRKHLLVDFAGEVRRCIHEKRQRIDRQLPQWDAARGLQGEPDRTAATPIEAQAGAGERTRAHDVAGRLDRERPQRNIVCGAVLARGAGPCTDLGSNRAAASDLEPLLQAAFRQRRFQFHHGARRHRRQERRIHHLEQVLREIRVSRIELQLHACGEKCEGFYETLDVGICAVDAVHAETGSDARIRLGEFRSHLADVLQFPVVVLEQPRVHGLATSWPRDRPLRRCRCRRRYWCAKTGAERPADPRAPPRPGTSTSFPATRHRAHRALP